jgi:hypothetical protein
MKYYKLINESLHKLIEEQSSDSLNIEVMDRKEVFKEFIDYVASVLKKDWKDVIVIDNVIYVIEEDFETTIDSGETVDVKNGIFSIYQFTGGEVIDYRVNLNTISDINQIGKKPLSYFTHGWNNDLHNLDDFFSNYDRYFGRNTFISEEFDAYLSNLKNSLGLEENMLNEEDEQEGNLEDDNNIKEVLQHIGKVKVVSKEAVKKYGVFTEKDLNSVIKNKNHLEYFKNKIIEHFGLSLNPRIGSCVILTDGSFINFKGEHSDSILYLQQVGLLSKSWSGMAFYSLFNAIFYDCADFSGSALRLPEKKITEQQEKSILSVLDLLVYEAPSVDRIEISDKGEMYKRSIYASFRVKKGASYSMGAVMSDVNLTEITPDYILKRIREYYRTGKLKEDFDSENAFIKDGDEDNLKVLSKEDIITSFEESGENPFEIMGVDIFTKYPYLIPRDDFNKMYDMLGSWGGLKKIPEAVKYIKEFFISEFNRVNRNASRFKMSFEDIRMSISSNLDDNFVRGLFEGTGVYEFFSYDSKDIDFSSYDVDKINEKNIKKLSEIGFSEEDLKKIASGEGLDEEHPLVRWNDYLLSIIKRALSEGTAVGTEQDAFEHFNDLFSSSLPEGVIYDSRKDDGDYKYLEVYPSFFDDKDNLGVLWENMYDINDDVDNAIKHSVIEIFNGNFYMSDSDNYDGFSKEAFNDRLEEDLVEFEEDVKKQK